MAMAWRCPEATIIIVGGIARIPCIPFAKRPKLAGAGADIQSSASATPTFADKQPQPIEPTPKRPSAKSVPHLPCAVRPRK